MFKDKARVYEKEDTCLFKVLLKIQKLQKRGYNSEGKEFLREGILGRKLEENRPSDLRKTNSVERSFETESDRKLKLPGYFKDFFNETNI